MSDLVYDGRKTGFYIAEDNVAKTVRLAIRLKRPILVEGEPGCGKTMLAHSIKEELALELMEFVVRSTSRAQDMLYQVDSLRRLQDAQHRDNQQSRYIHPYLTLGPLGQAIHYPHLDDKRRVVLIDEIDKADIDFPNDLLGVLDRFQFDIEALPEHEIAIAKTQRKFGKHIEARPGYEPIIVITSNREKRLPEPFLRRCIYVRILFPQTQDRLRDIVLMNLKTEAAKINKKTLEAAVAVFWGIRQQALGMEMQKPPTTSELIDWVRVLHWEGKTAKEIEKDRRFPPYWNLMFKTMNDLELYEKQKPANGEP